MSLEPHRRETIAWLDAVFAFLVALLCVVYSNSSRIPAGELRHFLELRITVVNAGFAALFTFLWAFCFDTLGTHHQENRLPGRLARLVLGCGLMSVVLASYLAISRTAGPTVRIVGTFFCVSLIYECFRLLISRYIAARHPRRVLILGTGRRAAKAWHEIRIHHHGLVELLGFVDDRSVDEMSPDIRARYVGRVENLEKLLLKNPVDDLLVALPARSCYELAQATILMAESVGVRVICLRDVYDSSTPRSARHAASVFSELVPARYDHYTMQVLKRLVDVIVSFVGIVALAPFLAAIAVAIKATSKGPVFFLQPKIGYRRRVFRIFKFRTMVDGASDFQHRFDSQVARHGIGFKLPDDPRVTPLGKLLRSSSLDGLPQLFNVLLGDMSLVGPRPLATTDVDRFGDAMLLRRFKVKPGVTGLWQVNGRSSLSFRQAMNLDLSYIDDWSLSLDFRILLKTIPAVAKKVGAV